MRSTKPHAETARCIRLGFKLTARAQLAPLHDGGFEPVDGEVHQRGDDRKNGDRGHDDVELKDLATVLDQLNVQCPERIYRL